MTHLGYDNVPELVSETELGRFTAFASDLGIRVGCWPVDITTSLGNKMPFIYDPSMDEVREGDLVSRTYRQANGCISLKIYND